MQAFLYTVIFFEGYVVLAAELLAIRQMTPVAGSSTDVISIIIAAVLMPLAFGYDAGGRFKAPEGQEQYLGIRKKLAQNFLISGFILCLGLSGYVIKHFFEILDQILPYNDRLLYVAIYSVIFLITPVFLLGQTIPLLTNLFEKENLPRVTGKILFFSTMGSFVGSIVSTIVLMMTIGVYNTVIVVITILALLGIGLNPKKLSKMSLAFVGIIFSVWFLNANHMKEKLDIVEDNAYNIIQIKDIAGGGKILMLDESFSAGIREGNLIFPYTTFIQDVFLYPIETPATPKKDILIIGAGGFTMGLYDQHNNYTYVDIDKSLKEISEKYFLEQELGENKVFAAQPARRFLNQVPDDVKYDFVVVDVFRGKTMPEMLVTQEFFQSVKRVLKPEARLVMNVMICPNLSDDFSVNIDATIRSVFPTANYFLTGAEAINYNGWKEYKRENGYNCAINGLYTYFHTGKKPVIYTDNKNAVSFDY